MVATFVGEAQLALILVKGPVGLSESQEIPHDTIFDYIFLMMTAYVLKYRGPKNLQLFILKVFLQKHFQVLLFEKLLVRTAKIT